MAVHSFIHSIPNPLYFQIQQTSKQNKAIETKLYLRTILIWSAAPRTKTRLCTVIESCLNHGNARFFIYSRPRNEHIPSSKVIKKLKVRKCSNISDLEPTENAFLSS